MAEHKGQDVEVSFSCVGPSEAELWLASALLPDVGRWRILHNVLPAARCLQGC